MSVLAMPTLNGWGKKIISAAAVVTAITVLSAYIGSFIPSYALASDLKAHIESSDNRYEMTMRRELKKNLKNVNNSLDLYSLDRDMRELTPREKLRVNQLKNEKEELIQELNETNPR